MNAKLSRDDLYALEEYSRLRQEFRTRVLEHKKHRKVQLGDHVTLLFENRLTIQYQVQEMLRVERIFEDAAIRDELDAYNPLIPDGHNWKATMLIEYTDAEERRASLQQLVGIETRIWVTVGDMPWIHPVADEDMERTTPEKTSAVHFLRFELPAQAVAALKDGANLSMGIDHPNYHVSTEIPEATRESLIADLD